MTTDTDLGAGTADLHMHTTASDGTVDVDERIDLAREHELTSIAITDHDTIADDISSPIKERRGIELIAGVEVRADLFDTKIEVLGYFVDPKDDTLRSLLRQSRDFRRQRNEKLVSNLTEATGLDLCYDELVDSVEGNLGRPHLANVLVRKGVVSSISEAFDHYLGEGCESFVPMQRLPAKKVISAIHGAGGATSLAHPGRIRTDSETVTRMVKRLSDVGIDGIEVRYPYDATQSDDYANIDIETASDLADRFELIPTGGSDCHGPGSGKFRMGTVRVSSCVVERLRERAGRSV